MGGEMKMIAAPEFLKSTFPEGIPSMVLIWVGVILVVVVGTIIYNIWRSKKVKAGAAEFLVRHPDAIKVWPVVKAGITTSQTFIHEIDDDVPVEIHEKGKVGYLVIPGKRKLSVSSTYTRPGVMYKTVSETVGPVEKTVNFEARKDYKIGYNRKTEKFEIEEA